MADIILSVKSNKTKLCILCQNVYPKTDEYFFYRSKKRGWFSSWCKQCKKEYRKAKREIELQQQRIRRGNKSRKEKKSKEVIREYMREYYEKHREVILKRVKIYGEKNSDKIKGQSKIYRKKNAELIRKEKQEYKIQRKLNDPCYALKLRISKLVYITLKQRRLSKGGRSFWKLIGYTPEELSKHIELQFVDGMSWDNRGEWHIDHIKPQSLFVFNSMDTKEFKECWSLENLQPLWAVENIQKSNHYSYGE